MGLKGSKKKQLRIAIGDAFTQGELEMLFNENTGKFNHKNLSNLVSAGDSYDKQVSDLVNWLERQEKVEDFLEVAKFYNPGNIKLKIFRDDYLSLSKKSSNSISEIQIFLAHANEDKPQVRDLYRRLKQVGYQPWLDEEDLLPGQNWRDEIPKAIQSSDIFIACLSSQSVSKRGYVQREFRQALNKMAEMPVGEIYLIPLKLDECEIPDLRQSEYGVNLRDIQWLDYWQPGGWEKLLKSIELQSAKLNWGQPSLAKEENY